MSVPRERELAAGGRVKSSRLFGLNVSPKGKGTLSGRACKIESLIWVQCQPAWLVVKEVLKYLPFVCRLALDLIVFLTRERINLACSRSRTPRMT
ncbi:MAG: hypothetical protein EAZ28_06200 [Oscillatoriales cyanobacterium]|nr:MAG: hypothetical protein EAZ28_06200 [Oscillatoriales cyanobacterium]